jgi:hypothetical protein
MRAARTQKELAHRNTVVLRTLKVYFQRFAGKGGTDAERGISGVDYVVKVGGRVVDKGTTAADGSITLQVPAGERVELELFGTTYEVHIRNSLEGNTNVSGQQRRLAMLGYELGDVDGNFGEKSDFAALCFQADASLDPDGQIGPATRGRLTSEFGE